MKCRLESCCKGDGEKSCLDDETKVTEKKQLMKAKKNNFICSFAGFSSEGQRESIVCFMGCLYCFQEHKMFCHINVHFSCQFVSLMLSDVILLLYFPCYCITCGPQPYWDVKVIPHYTCLRLWWNVSGKQTPASQSGSKFPHHIYSIPSSCRAA